MEIIAERNCIICDFHLIFLMWLHRESWDVQDLQLTLEDKRFTQNYTWKISSTEITFKNLSACVCVCTCLPAHVCVYEWMMLNCTIMKLVVKMGSVSWVCLTEIHTAGNINVRIHTLEPENWTSFISKLWKTFWTVLLCITLEFILTQSHDSKTEIKYCYLAIFWNLCILINMQLKICTN
jgi:hypothetical protein